MLIFKTQILLSLLILDTLFKTGISGTQWYCVIPGTFSVPCRNPDSMGNNSNKNGVLENYYLTKLYETPVGTNSTSPIQPLSGATLPYPCQGPPYPIP